INFRPCRFQRHPTLWATAGLVALDTLAHRTEEFARANLLHALRRLLMRVFVLVRFRGARPVFAQDFLAAILAAQVEELTIALGTASGCFIDSHVTDRVNCHDGSFAALNSSSRVAEFAQNVGVGVTHGKSWRLPLRFQLDSYRRSIISHSSAAKPISLRE